jgi:hypothetical protein
MKRYQKLQVLKDCQGSYQDVVLGHISGQASHAVIVDFMSIYVSCSTNDLNILNSCLNFCPRV